MENQSLRLQSPWEDVKEKIKEKNIELTDEDLQYEKGQEDELLNRLTGKLGKTPDEVRMYIESVAANKGMAG